MLKKLVEVTGRSGKSLTLCGEVASDPLYVPLLIGLGYTKLSINPLSINLVKDIINRISYKQAQGLVKKALKMKTAKDIRKLLEGYFSKIKKLCQIYIHPIDNVS